MIRLWRQFRALALLGVQALILQPIKRLRNLGRSGESRFLEAYTPDLLLPLSMAERERRDRFGACIHCGLCDVVCDALVRANRSRVAALSAVPIGLSRSMSEYPFARLSLEELRDCGDCVRCEKVCPVGVPLREIMADAREHASRLEAECLASSEPPRSGEQGSSE